MSPRKPFERRGWMSHLAESGSDEAMICHD
jgi:hypothetical protein